MFGLGNKQYVDFCAVGKRVHKAMQSCGAEPVIYNGEGNDEADINGDFRQWRDDLIKALDLSSILKENLKVITSPSWFHKTNVIACRCEFT